MEQLLSARCLTMDVVVIPASDPTAIFKGSKITFKYPELFIY